MTFPENRRWEPHFLPGHCCNSTPASWLSASWLSASWHHTSSVMNQYQTNSDDTNHESHPIYPINSNCICPGCHGSLNAAVFHLRRAALTLTALQRSLKQLLDRSRRHASFKPFKPWPGGGGAQPYDLRQLDAIGHCNRILQIHAMPNELCSKLLLISWARTQSLRRSLRSPSLRQFPISDSDSVNFGLMFKQYRFPYMQWHNGIVNHRHSIACNSMHQMKHTTLFEPQLSWLDMGLRMAYGNMFMTNAYVKPFALLTKPRESLTTRWSLCKPNTKQVRGTLERCSNAPQIFSRLHWISLANLWQPLREVRASLSLELFGFGSSGWGWRCRGVILILRNDACTPGFMAIHSDIPWISVELLWIFMNFPDIPWYSRCTGAQALFQAACSLLAAGSQKARAKPLSPKKPQWISKEWNRMEQRGIA